MFSRASWGLWRNDKSKLPACSNVRQPTLRAAEKLGLTSRVEIVRYAAAQGWLADV